MSSVPKDPASRASAEWLEHFADFSSRYDIALCDIWGVVHNGVTAWPAACDALTRFRERGGRVALITNAPRPSDKVQSMLTRLAVPDSVRDVIVSSGDITRGEIAAHDGARIFHLGPGRDLSLFEGFNVTRVGADDAELIVNTGLFDDDDETPDDYRDLLAGFAGRGLRMVCANPDIVVERGDRLVYCAGALADLYESLGGDVLWAGKPHAPIYARALEELGCRDIPRRRCLAIGDSIRTDMRGAEDYGVDALFIAGGIHAGEMGGRDSSVAGRLQAAFDEAGVAPKAVMGALAW